jgi:hypothetical protein
VLCCAESVTCLEVHDPGTACINTSTIEACVCCNMCCVAGWVSGLLAGTMACPCDVTIMDWAAKSEVLQNIIEPRLRDTECACRSSGSLRRVAQRILHFLMWTAHQLRGGLTFSKHPVAVQLLALGPTLLNILQLWCLLVLNGTWPSLLP